MPNLPRLVTPVDYLVLITDRNCNYLGDPILCWTEIDVTLRWNEPGSGYFECPGYPWIVDMVSAGNRVVMVRNQQVLIAGPIEGWLHERSDDGDNAGDGRLRVDFADDLALIVARGVYPNPAQTVPGQSVDTWTFTGNAEVGLRTLVNLNAGPGALAPRPVPGLVLGTLAGVGSNVTVTAQRMQPLGDVARAIAETGGNLGFRTRQVGNQVQFQTFASPDKSAEIRFGFGLGNLRYVANEVKAPTATAVAVGGQGTGASAYMVERVNAAEQTAWGRFERFVAQNGQDPVASLNDEGDRALADGAATTRVAANVSDSQYQKYGDYDVGTIVSLEVADGVAVSDVVRTVHFQMQASAGEYVSATIGSQAATTDPIWSQRMREIDERLGRLERIAVPA